MAVDGAEVTVRVGVQVIPTHSLGQLRWVGILDVHDRVCMIIAAARPMVIEVLCTSAWIPVLAADMWVEEWVTDVHLITEQAQT